MLDAYVLNLILPGGLNHEPVASQLIAANMPSFPDVWIVDQFRVGSARNLLEASAIGIEKEPKRIVWLALKFCKHPIPELRTRPRKSHYT